MLIIAGKHKTGIRSHETQRSKMQHKAYAGEKVMRELKYAILGLVNREPITGYDITKLFSENLSKFWYAQHSQIYPELKRLVTEGLIEYTVTITGEKLEKKLYSITKNGRSHLRDWINTDEGLPPIAKDPFRLRLYFSEHLSKAEVAELIESQSKKHKLRLDELVAEYYSYKEKPAVNDPNYGDYLLIMGGIDREKAYIKWLGDCIDVTGCRG